MIDKINASLSFQAEALKLRATRQQLLAANIANADTPNYKATDFDFTRALLDAERGMRGNEPAVRVDPVIRERGGQVSLDGNSVDMDVERVQFADNALRYEATLRFINGKLRTLLSAIQG